MRRRIVQATVAAIAVTVILLGVPMAVFGVVMVWDNQVREIQARAEALGRSVDRRVGSEEPLDDEMLDPYTGGPSQPSARVEVVTAGQRIQAGTPIDGRVEDVTLVTGTGAVVTIEVSWWDLAWKCIAVVVLIIIASLVAFGAGIALAVWQARRLAAPLVYLAASAEQLGAGQTRPRLEPSGVEEIDLVAAELARSADRMAARLAVERQFAADASHQLRTPLTALTMRIEEIQLSSTQPEIEEEARISLEQISRLVSVVDDLLTRSRHADGGTTEPTRLTDIVHQQDEEWRPAFDAAGRTLVADIAPNVLVLASPGALAQVLATLIENSLRHGKGSTTIRARTSGTSGRAVVIEVSDEGPGIPDEIANSIFDRNVTTGLGGAGLGLALARDLVAADGGRLELAQRRPPVFAVFLSGVPTRLDPEDVLPLGGRSPDLRERRRRTR